MTEPEPDQDAEQEGSGRLVGDTEEASAWAEAMTAGELEPQEEQK